MNDAIPTREQLIAENTALRQHIASLEAAQAAQTETEKTLQASEEGIHRVVEDITECPQAEIMAQQSAERFAKAFQVSPVAMGITRLRDGHYLAVNDSFLQATGYQRDEILGRTSLDIERWVDDEARTRVAQELLVHGAVHKVETPMRIKSGEIRDTLFSATVIELDGDPCILAITQDITEQKQTNIARQQAEEALRKSEEQFRQVADNMQEFLWISAPHTPQLLYVNPAYETIWGSTCESLYAEPMSWLEAVHPEDRKTVYSTLERPRRGEITDVEYRIIRPDGTVRWVRDRAFPIRYTSGQVDRIAGIVEDITDRKQAAEARQKLEAQLHQMQKMDAIGTLAGGIAHEFNNMLAAILGFTQLATAEMPSTSPISQYLQVVEIAGKRAKDLVQQLLAFSHPSPHKREPVDITGIVHESLKLLRASLPATIEIQLHIVPETSVVLADTTQMHQVLMNLCSNAEYAMRETGGILEISVDTVEVDAAFATLHSDLQLGPHVRLRIHDTGPGMPPDVVDRIFEPFFTTKEIGEGTGMGLAIVHGIISSYRGAIVVESTPGEGSTFTIYLPQITHAPATVADPPEPVIPQGKGCILFVDDEEVLARLGAGLLARLGYEVEPYTSSLDALEAFQAEPDRFDLVITDQTMPSMTGATLTEELRRHRPDIPIILHTGFSHLMNAEKAETLGVDAFVMKPVMMQELALTIQQVLDKRAQREH